MLFLKLKGLSLGRCVLAAAAWCCAKTFSQPPRAVNSCYDSMGVPATMP